MNYTVSLLSIWVVNIIEYFNAKKKADDNSRMRDYIDQQMRDKESAMKNLKDQQDKIKGKVDKLKEEELIIKKNLVVKNKYWILENCMKVLLADGCNPNIMDNSGETLLIDAIKRKKLGTVRLLLENDCKVTIRNGQGMSPIG
jgi:hypothetical protein